ncbi:MAG: DUF2189 domain-containing protein [Geminicoccaceae bacterium]
MGLHLLGYLYNVLPARGGFLIVPGRSDRGPLRGEPARRRAVHEPEQALLAYHRNSSQIALMGVALMLVMFAWARIAALIFFLYFGLTPPHYENLIASTFLDTDALPFLVLRHGGRRRHGAARLRHQRGLDPLLLDRPEANVSRR